MFIGMAGHCSPQCVGWSIIVTSGWSGTFSLWQDRSTNKWTIRPWHMGNHAHQYESDWMEFLLDWRCSSGWKQPCIVLHWFLLLSLFPWNIAPRFLPLHECDRITQWVYGLCSSFIVLSSGTSQTYKLTLVAILQRTYLQIAFLMDCSSYSSYSMNMAIGPPDCGSSSRWEQPKLIGQGQSWGYTQKKIFLISYLFPRATSHKTTSM